MFVSTLKTGDITHNQDSDNTRSSRKVSNNLEAYKANMQAIIDTLRKNDIFVANKYLGENKFPVTPTDLIGLDDIASPCHQDDIFKCLRSGDETVMDKGRFLALAEDITAGKKGNKNVNFTINEVQAGKLKTKPLTTEDYVKGAPFFLSCKTKHCDFPGAVGGNYPVAEYLSDNGVSTKVFNRNNEYVGHYNLWKLSNGDFCIGTIAMVDNHRTSKYSEKDLKHLVLAQAASLLEDNSDAKNVLLGMGGHNLKNILPGRFDKGSEGFHVLGQLRYADIDPNTNQQMLTQLEKITKLKVSKVSPEIVDQEKIGMLPEQRKDFKNALLVLNRDNLAQNKKILKNYEETKTQSSIATNKQRSLWASLKINKEQRSIALQNTLPRREFVKTELLNDTRLSNCELISVSGMDVLLRVDESLLKQTELTLNDKIKDFEGITIRKGFRNNELRVKIPHNLVQGKMD